MMIGAARLGSSSLNRMRAGRHAHHPGRLDELALAQREHLAADQAGDAHPAEDRQHDDQGRPSGSSRSCRLVSNRSLMIGAMRQRGEQERDRQEQVDEERQDLVDRAAEEAGEQADDDADDARRRAVAVAAISSEVRQP